MATPAIVKSYQSLVNDYTALYKVLRDGGVPMPTEDNALVIKSPNDAKQADINQLKKAISLMTKQYKAAVKSGKITAILPGVKLPMKAPEGPVGGNVAPTLVPSSDAAAKRAALEAEIKATMAEIERLKKLREKLTNSAEKKQKELDNLKDIPESFLKYLGFIETNCSEFLAALVESGKNRALLYRGMDGAPGDIFRGQPRENRRAKDSDQRDQERLDEILEKAGFTALRRNSIFTTSDSSQAEGYGDTYAIFPLNGFTYTWSTKIRDMVIGSEINFDDEEIDDATLEKLTKTARELTEFLHDDLYYSMSNSEKKMYSELTKEISDYFLLRTEPGDIDRAERALKLFRDALPKFTGDILVRIDDYFNTNPSTRVKKMSYYIDKALAAIPKAKARMEEIRAKNSSPDLVIRKLGLTNTNLPLAIKKGHEVMIRGEYVAIRADADADNWHNDNTVPEQYYKYLQQFLTAYAAGKSLPKAKAKSKK